MAEQPLRRESNRWRESYGFVLQVVTVAVIAGLAHAAFWVAFVIGLVNGFIASLVWLSHGKERCVCSSSTKPRGTE